MLDERCQDLQCLMQSIRAIVGSTVCITGDFAPDWERKDPQLV